MIRFARWLLATFVLAATALAGGLMLFTWRTARRVEAALPARGRFIDIDGARLHYVDGGAGEGAGPAIVLIHGLGGQLMNFPADSLEPLRRDYRVIALDRPGSGYSTRPAGASAALGAQAATIAGFIRALGLERPLVVGHSLGGAVALAVALEHPESVGGLALISPLTQVHDTAPVMLRGLAIRSSLVRRVVAWTLATPASVRNHELVMPMLFGPDAVPADFPIRGGGLLSLRPSSFYAASSDMVAVNEDLPGLVSRYGSITVPVGILYGTGDRVLDSVANGTAMLEAIPGLDLELIENGGHMTPITAPAHTEAFIRRMAGKIAAANGKPP